MFKAMKPMSAEMPMKAMPSVAAMKAMQQPKKKKVGRSIIGEPGGKKGAGGIECSGV